jgi:hypothetical protein
MSPDPIVAPPKDTRSWLAKITITQVVGCQRACAFSATCIAAGMPSAYRQHDATYTSSHMVASNQCVTQAHAQHQLACLAGPPCSDISILYCPFKGKPLCSVDAHAPLLATSPHQVLFFSFSTIIGIMIATFFVVLNTGAVRLAGLD